MKLYHLNPNNYGEELFVIAESKEDAVGFFQQYIESDKHTYYDKHDAEVFKKDNWKMRGYTIDECEVGQVIESEVA